ncbi:hypothetical protein scyTo_0025243, partial [Scyliorhinus torazame]|nr:hypothetical protein [Scyliorhinus torazame]
MVPRRARIKISNRIFLQFKHERLLDLLEKEKSVLQEKIKEALEEQKKQHKDALERCVAEERRRSTEAMGKVVK